MSDSSIVISQSLLRLSFHFKSCGLLTLFVLMSDPLYCALFVSVSDTPVLCTVRVNVRPLQCTVHSLCQCPTPSVYCALFVSMFCPLSASAIFELNVNFRPIVLWTLCVYVSVRLTVLCTLCTVCPIVADSLGYTLCGLSCAYFLWQTVLCTLSVDSLVYAFCGRQSLVHFLWIVLCMVSVADSLGSTFCRQPWKTAVYALTAFVWLCGWIYK